MVRASLFVSLALHAAAFYVLKGPIPNSLYLKGTGPIFVEFQGQSRFRSPMAKRKSKVPAVISEVAKAQIEAEPEADGETDHREPESSELFVGLNQVLADGNDSPVYPNEAQRAGWQGEVLLRLWLLATGSVREVELIQSSGYEVLDNAAIHAAQKWHFSPSARTIWDSARPRLVPIDFKLID